MVKISQPLLSENVFLNLFIGKCIYIAENPLLVYSDKCAITCKFFPDLFLVNSLATLQSKGDLQLSKLTIFMHEKQCLISYRSYYATKNHRDFAGWCVTEF